MMFSDSIFLVTGATGRLGCEMICRLEKLGAAVIPVVLSGYPILPKRVEWASNSKPLSVKSTDDLSNLTKPTTVINFHWTLDRSLAYTDQLVYEINHNVHKTAFFWEWLKDGRCKHFINISTINIFSRLNDNPISADTEPCPVTPYGIAKYTAEKFFDANFSGSKVDVTHLRICSVASYGEHPSQLLSRLYQSAWEKQSMTINAGHWVSLIYIDELIDLIIRASAGFERPRYILAKPNLAVEEIASLFERISGKNLNAEYVGSHPGSDDLIFISDIDDFYTDWIRVHSVEEMIRSIINLNQHVSQTGANRLMRSENPVFSGK
jgi:nucleoside-diphosphate-sugar epimerase